jgi:Fe-S cluster assembly protein SufD
MTSRVVTRTTRTTRPTSKEFSFTREMVPVLQGMDSSLSFIIDYRDKAWQFFEQKPIPTTTEEAWRRTDLRNLDAGGFRLADASSGSNLPHVPEALLQPLVSDQQSGQIVLLPGNKVQTEINPELTSDGVVFTDLVTAERDHPDILKKVL